MPLTTTEGMIKQDPFYQKGFREGLRQVVIRLRKKGLSVEEVAELLELQVEEVREFLKTGGKDYASEILSRSGHLGHQTEQQACL